MASLDKVWVLHLVSFELWLFLHFWVSCSLRHCLEVLYKVWFWDSDVIEIGCGMYSCDVIMQYLFRRIFCCCVMYLKNVC